VVCEKLQSNSVKVTQLSKLPQFTLYVRSHCAVHKSAFKRFEVALGLQ